LEFTQVYLDFNPMNNSSNRRVSCLVYLLLNVVISAATTLVVLILWQRAHPMPIVPSVGGGAQASATATLPAQATAPGAPAATHPAGQVVMTIVNVFSPGALSNEVVLIKNSSAFNIPLAGWQLEDGQGNNYVFPALDLSPDGAINVHTGPGADTAIDLYWNRDASVWQVGKTVTLRDDQGVVRSTYTIK
jgi:Lamin Tail Domain